MRLSVERAQAAHRECRRAAEELEGARELVGELHAGPHSKARHLLDALLSVCPLHVRHLLGTACVEPRRGNAIRGDGSHQHLRWSGGGRGGVDGCRRSMPRAVRRCPKWRQRQRQSARVCGELTWAKWAEDAARGHTTRS